MRRLAWLSWGLMISACVAPLPVLRPVTGDDVTVLVHGYRGGVLSTVDGGEVAWLTAGQALRAGERSLALPFEGQREAPRYGALVATGPLTKLTAIPLLVEEDAYLGFIDWAKDALPGLVLFAYDWRQDVRESGQALCRFIEGLGPGRRVRVVAHSMGGLVTLQCLRRGPELVRERVTHVVFAGTPFRGGAGIWDDLHLGTVSGANRRLMDAEALLTFPASWQLLAPRPGFFVDAQRAPVDVRAYEADTWVERGWGLFAAPEVRASPAYRAQLEARFEAHAALWASLADEPGPPPPYRVMTIVGTGRPVVTGWRVTAEGGFDFAAPVRGDGDGVVAVESVVAPRPLGGVVVRTTEEHSAMLRAPAVQAVLERFLRE